MTRVSNPSNPWPIRNSDTCRYFQPSLWRAFQLQSQTAGKEVDQNNKKKLGHSFHIHLTQKYMLLLNEESESKFYILNKSENATR